MMKVPANKTVYIKSRKYVEGQELPGGVYIDFADEKEIKDKYAGKKPDKVFNFEEVAE